MKKIAVMLCSLFLFSMLGGCMVDNEKRENLKKEESLTKEQRVQDLLQYLEGRYHEEFEYTAVAFDSFEDTGTSFYAYPKGENENYSFFAGRYVGGDGSISYRDGYAAFKMEPYYQEMISETVKKYFPEFRIRLGINQDTPDWFAPDSTFEEYRAYIEKNQIEVFFTIFVPSDSEEATTGVYQQFLAAIKQELPAGYSILSAYQPMHYQEDIEQDVLKTREENTLYPSRNEWFNLREQWGQKK